MRTAIVLSFVIMVGAIVFFYQGQPVGTIEVSTPHPYSTCQQDRDLAPLLHWHLEQHVHPEMDPQYVKQKLIQANIAADYPYDWCAPRLALRGTLDFWQADVETWAVAWLDILPLPPKRPRFYAKKKPKMLHAAVTIPVKVTTVQPPQRPRGTNGQGFNVLKIPSAAL
jgi:hypothetical protein